MGVPALYKWVTMRYPDIKLSLDKNIDHLTDVLYLDFNAIIHPCCNKELPNMYDTDNELYKNLEVFLDNVLREVRPKRLLYISIDGVAPKAKLNQQRARRFTGAKEVESEGKVYFTDDCGSTPNNKKQQKQASNPEDKTVEVFDTNAITPGTQFMERLDCYIRELIKCKISSNAIWKNINVIFSGYHVPGEGEQKIMEYIRKHQNKKYTAIIYSPDADLIFLGLSLFDYDVKILREEPAGKYPNQSKNNVFSLVDIPKLKKLLINQFKSAIKVSFDHRRFLEDWVLLCFTVGNDFLPCSPCFEIRANALDKLTHILQNVYQRTRSFITDNGKINNHILREFFRECARREDDFIVEKRNNLIKTRQRMKIDFDPRDEFFLDSQNGKTRFYTEKMGIKSEPELLEACKEYIKGFHWVYSYYFYDITSWSWYYPYHFAPFMADLADVNNLIVEFDYARPLKPMEQLLNVLPPLSKALLPKCLSPIFDEFKDYYPVDFKLDMFQKCIGYQAVPILPFMNSKEIVKSYEEKQSQLTFEESQRNLLGNTLLYSCQPKLIAKLYPLYTELKVSDHVSFDEYTGRVCAVPEFVPIDEIVNKYGFKYINRTVTVSFDQKETEKKVK